MSATWKVKKKLPGGFSLDETCVRNNTGGFGSKDVGPFRASF